MDVRGYVESNGREFVDALKQWLAIPSMSADPAYHGDVRRSAQWLADHLRGIGFPVAEVWDAADEGLPATFVEWLAARPPPRRARGGVGPPRGPGGRSGMGCCPRAAPPMTRARFSSIRSAS